VPGWHSSSNFHNPASR